ncbi:hypothetical protein Selin_1212 [Desulfurispirillum indicum S5]|uniref:Uncharacterized protein n=1 Tax=Desulfurispirillum indicum (strain ATCC BAA-1389 / DSM 22839 / S5) TaxID=653733 RepID=E6W4X1_DESIS|nr:hypothetical protein Selin_1212 [Desulfurispirillum indicum S5]
MLDSSDIPLFFLDIVLFDRAKRTQKRAPRTPVLPAHCSPVLEIRQTLPPCSAAGPLTSCECPVRVLPARRRTHRTGSGRNGLLLHLPRVLAQPGRADWNAMEPQGCRHEGGNRKPKAMEGGCLRSPVPGMRMAEKDSTGGRFCATFGESKVARKTPE